MHIPDGYLSFPTCVADYGLQIHNLFFPATHFKINLNYANSAFTSHISQKVK